jgi:hypothetical protein
MIEQAIANARKPINETDTPETDAFKLRPCSVSDWRTLVTKEHARRLERDRDKWRGIAERLAELLACLEYVGTDVTDWPTVYSVKTALAAFEEAKK